MDREQFSFDGHVRPDELRLIAAARAQAGLAEVGPALPLAGLALSGGGIRSATFNLGLLQALAEGGKLRRFDFLSTVSGGGYIGGWLAAWIHRRGLDEVESQLAASVNGSGAEPHEVRWLRAHSNYLTPRKGLISLDTLWGVSTYLRNLVTNQFLLVVLVTTVLVAGAAVHALGLRHAADFPLAAWAVGAALFLLAAPVVGCEFAHLRGQSPRSGVAPLVCALREGLAHWVIAGLTVAGSAIMAYALVQPAFVRALGADPVLTALPWAMFAAFWILAALTVPLAFRAPRDMTLRAIVVPEWTWVAWLALGTAVFAGFLEAFQPLGQTTATYPWLTPLLAPALFIAAFEVGTLVLIMLAGRALRPFAHDWLSRMAAAILVISALPAAVFVSWVLLAPTIDFLLSMQPVTLSAATLGWIASTLAGVLGGKSSATGQAGSRRWIEALLAVTPFVFLLGLFTVIVWAAREVVLWAAGLQPEVLMQKSVLAWMGAVRVNLDLLGRVPAETWTAAGLLLAATTWLLAWRVDINLFSFHSYYRNRLAHAYLGASARGRKANAFTGYAPGDSPDLEALARMAPDKAIRPYPLVNTALNLAGAPRMEWQSRKAASFVFSPLYCGFELPAPLSLNRDTSDCRPEAAAPAAVQAHRRTADFIRSTPGRQIGQSLAITISGAAASPHMGYHTSPAIAALLTAFNVRLGWWMPSPRHAEAWARGGPNYSTAWMVKELTAHANEDDRFVYLSDGGHFENLGVYELLRRRCKLIMASDASADAPFHFEDLANLVHKARADLGVEIDADAVAIRPAIDPSGVIGASKSNYIVARIAYPPAPGAPGTETGWLVYVKSSLPEKLPADIENYRWAKPGFPHQSTGDQWFDEVQFEAYRRLGLEIGRIVTRDLRLASLQPPSGW